MYRATVDYGIDLGTTNSVIALSMGPQRIDVFKNNEGEEYTASAVYLDRRGNLVVGRIAKEKVESDGDNACCEFKLQMGTEHEFTFVRSGQRMRPEDLSAEVLKSLKGDALQKAGEDLSAAVITVPAMFELPQCEATRRAAQLAGLAFSPLLQEPVAAALAYGFQSDSDKVFWLVYDFGGGTFDAALVHFSDGAIQVVNHGGDNHLGGKLIDWEIVDQLFIPALTKEYPLPDFSRANARWKPAMAKLKLAAERAKIRCSRLERDSVDIDSLCQDDRGEPVELHYDLHRRDVERLMEPFIVRSLNLSRRVLSERGVGPGDVEKVLLVGGPTLTPYLRERLSDRQTGLGLPLELTIDPLTVVARGAAIFARSQRMPDQPRATAAGQYTVQLEYRPMGADTEPLIGGKVLGASGEDLSRFTVELVNAEALPPWRSGKIGLSPTGTFTATLWAEKGRANTFLIELYGPAGQRCQTVPDRITYDVAIDAPEQPLVQSLGVALADNTVDTFFEKGASLPSRKRKVKRTAVHATCGQAGPVIRIPVVEGEHKRADRNRRIGTLEILGSQIRRDVPAGSEVEVVLEIDTSRLVKATAFIPILDEEFPAVFKQGKTPATTRELHQCAAEEKERLRALRARAESAPGAPAQAALQKIDSERMVHDVEAALAAASADPDAADKCEKRLLDLQVAIDDLEDALQWPALQAEVDEALSFMHRIVDRFGKSADQDGSRDLETQAREALRRLDPDVVRRKLAAVRRHTYTVWQRHPEYWVGLFETLEDDRSLMRDHEHAAALFQRGRRAITAEDVQGLRGACQGLLELLPENERAAVGGRYGGTLM